MSETGLARAARHGPGPFYTRSVIEHPEPYYTCTLLIEIVEACTLDARDDLNHQRFYYTLQSERKHSLFSSEQPHFHGWETAIDGVHNL